MINPLLNPFIIYWDLNPAESDRDLNARICDEILRARLFVLNLRDTSGQVSESLVDILSKMTGKQPRVNVTVMASCLGEKTIENILSRDNTEVYVEFQSADELSASEGALKELHAKGHTTALSFYLTRDNWKDIPTVIKFCGENDIHELKLPIQRAGGEMFYLSSEEGIRLREQLKDIELSHMKLVIHDPFLWELFHGKTNPNEEGCNAARTMMFVDENYDVTPCPIMPVSIGNLRNSSLNDIFVSENRAKLRKDLSSSPLDCTTCIKSSACKGGCRGRTYVIHKSVGFKDPACQGEFFK